MNTLPNMTCANIDPILAKANATLEGWMLRDLSLVGKIAVVNALVLSMFVHCMSVIRLLNSKTINTIKSMVTKFIWNNGKAKIPDTAVKLLKREGGLGLIDIQEKDLALKIQWAFKAIEQKEIGNLTNVMLNNPIGSLLWQCNLWQHHIKETFRDGFWQDVLKAWAILHQQQERRHQNKLKEIIWYNSDITINQKVVFFKEFFDKKIIRV